MRGNARDYNERAKSLSTGGAGKVMYQFLCQGGSDEKEEGYLHHVGKRERRYPMGLTVRSVSQAMRVIKRMNYQGEGWADLHEAGRRGIKAAIEEMMQQNVRRRLEELYQGNEPDRRNGAYSRHILTSIGDIEVMVPRTRTFSAVGVLRAYARREKRVDRLILNCFVLGLSTRKVGEALLAILGERVSATTVSRIAKTLDAAVAAFHQRPLSNRYKAIVLDGVVLSQKSGAGANRRPVLVALGVTKENKKEIIDFRLARTESGAEWDRFLTSLFKRGLTGDGFEIIVVDGGKGLEAALPIVWPDVPVQRCWAHKTRNILDKVKKADWDRVKRHLNRIPNAESIVDARRAARRFADHWEKKYPAAVRCLRNDLDDLLKFFRYKDKDWRKATRTTNAIERRFREVRRRTRPMGVFTNTDSMERILFAVFSYENSKQGTRTPLLLLTQNS
jgi:transposase-like protein